MNETAECHVGIRRSLLRPCETLDLGHTHSTIAPCACGAGHARSEHNRAFDPCTGRSVFRLEVGEDRTPRPLTALEKNHFFLG